MGKTKIDDNIIKKITKHSIETAMEYMEKQKQLEADLKRDRRLRNIKLLLRNYRNFKKHIGQEDYELVDIDRGMMIKELGYDELALDSIRKSRRRTLSMVKFIDQMLEVYRLMCEQSEKDEDHRAYETIYKMYISERNYTAEEIAEIHFINVRTVYKDIQRGCEQLGVLIFGVDSIRFN